MTCSKSILQIYVFRVVSYMLRLHLVMLFVCNSLIEHLLWTGCFFLDVSLQINRYQERQECRVFAISCAGPEDMDVIVSRCAAKSNIDSRCFGNLEKRSHSYHIVKRNIDSLHQRCGRPIYDIDSLLVDSIGALRWSCAVVG